MKPQNVTVRIVEMNDGRRVFGVSFTVSRVFDPPRYPDGAIDEPLLEELVQDQANSIRGDVEALEIDMGEPDEQDEPRVVARDKDGRCFDVPRASLCRCGFVHAAGERCGPW